MTNNPTPDREPKWTDKDIVDAWESAYGGDDCHSGIEYLQTLQPQSPPPLPDWKEAFEKWYRSVWPEQTFEASAVRGACAYAIDWVETNLFQPLRAQLAAAEAEITALKEQLQNHKPNA